MIVFCDNPACCAEWQTVDEDKLCYACGSTGTKIGSDYMDDPDFADKMRKLAKRLAKEITRRREEEN